MKYYFRLKPDCYGELGEKAVVDFGKPFLQQTEYLHLHVNQMFESDLSIISDCWVVTELFRWQVSNMNLSGCEFIDMTVTYDKELEKYYPDIFPLPKLWRLNPLETSAPFDFYYNSGDIIVSSAVIEILSGLHYNHCNTIVEAGGLNAESLIALRRVKYW